MHAVVNVHIFTCNKCNENIFLRIYKEYKVLEFGSGARSTMALEMEKNDSGQQMRAAKMAQQVKVLGKPDNLEPT